jgi:hypothetical protein
MKIFAIATAWFFAGWFLYDITAYVVGMPRQATPMVALAVAITIVLALRGTSFDRPAMTLGVGSKEPHLPQLN